MKKTIISAVILLFTANILSAQETTFQKLDSLFYALDSNDRYMGSVAITEKGKTIYSNAIGYKDIDTQQKATTTTKYRIGSITKMFTASLVFKAMEEGKLALDQTLDVYFPSIPNAKEITLGNLLNHRSGIFNFTSSQTYILWNTISKTRDELIEIIEQADSVFIPNSKAEYSNSNYVLLTFILEDVYEKPYATIVQEKIASPIGLKYTYVDDKTQLENNEAYSFIYGTSWSKSKETSMSIPLGAGAIVSTPSDLGVFIDALFSEKIISSQNLGQMKTITDGYGMGIFEIPFHEKKGLGHNGGIDAFTSMLYYFPEDSLAVAVTTNGSRYSDNTLAIAALSSYYNKPFDIPSFETIEVNSAELDKYLGVYSSTQIPLKITITKKENVLIAQATGQPSFPMEATEVDVFEYLKNGVRLEFTPEKNTMVLKQGPGVFDFVKE